MIVKKLLIFAGTTEGRMLVEAIKQYPVKIYISVATEYGKESYDDTDAVVLSGRKDSDEINAFMTKHDIDLVIDATHPFAQIVSENIRSACKNADKEYIRCLRDGVYEISDDGDAIIGVSSIKEAVEFLMCTEGNILISTGSKELGEYTVIEDYKNRCYARVLSVKESVDASIALGFTGNHLIAMQGPFSKELNAAMIRQTKAKYFVTKDSGDAGGLEEKIQAARETGCILVMIKRPDEDGMSVKEVCAYLRNALI